MSLIYNNGKPIGRCDSYEIEKVLGASDFVKLKNFSFLNSNLTSNQDMLLDWMLEETKEIKEYGFHPTGIISELAVGRKWVPRQLVELWKCMEEHKRQEVLLRYLAIKNNYAVK
ncbi:hypothetical protein [Candidatus Enterococcus ferrettii]|uniref:Uncharacterized protein n=1 Tax=Candidatus Enterococcus ferrettii TaxID=2815324 RepID=A0ABV0EV43_9ENTE|nr:hypothetical protein [Enterococcus sp. 665A]MBO1340332.1 hypothetical protein [Enterococcus sp. 665A]